MYISLLIFFGRLPAAFALLFCPLWLARHRAAPALASEQTKSTAQQFISQREGSNVGLTLFSAGSL